MFRINALSSGEKVTYLITATQTCRTGCFYHFNVQQLHPEKGSSFKKLVFFESPLSERGSAPERPHAPGTVPFAVPFKPWEGSTLFLFVIHAM
jgi:hypothetical protein